MTMWRPVYKDATIYLGKRRVLAVKIASKLLVKVHLICQEASWMQKKNRGG